MREKIEENMTKNIVFKEILQLKGNKIYNINI
jgi:hypothetical protein